jgi:hypothetical protein
MVVIGNYLQVKYPIFIANVGIVLLPVVMQDLREHFLAEVEAFLARARLSASAFGRDVMGDPSFVAGLRKGRCPTSRTIQFARAHIARTEKLTEKQAAKETP